MKCKDKSVDLLREYDALDADSQIQLVEQLRATVSPAIDGHWCPSMRCSLVSPCRIHSCEVHFDREKSFNCMIFKPKAKPIENIALLLQVNTVQARDKAAEAIRQMRLSALDEAISKKSINHYTLVPNTDVCVNCGAVTEKSTIVTGKFKYCSRSCFVDKPPYVVALEHRFKTDPRIVLRVAKEVFKTLTMISAVLKIQRSNLIKMYERYLGIPAHDWGASVADIIDILRKKKPSSSIESFITLDKNDEVMYPHWFKFEKDCQLLAHTL